jgi:hypothetical protein
MTVYVDERKSGKKKCKRVLIGRVIGISERMTSGRSERKRRKKIINKMIGMTDGSACSDL